MAISVTTNYAGFFSPALVYKPLVMGSDLFSDAAYQLIPNANTGKHVFSVWDDGFAEPLVAESDCDFASNKTLANREVTIDMTKVGTTINNCASAFRDTVWQEALKRGVDFYDMQDTIAQELLQERINTAVTNHTYDLAWFGNDSSLNSTTNLTLIDGYFKKFAADSAVQKVTISGTGDLSSGEALTAMRATYSASLELEALPIDQKVFMVSNTVYLNLLKSYEDKDIDLAYTDLKDGIGVLRFRGIPVLPQLRWDKVMTVKGTSSPHRIVHTVAKNLIVASDVASTADNIEYWYEQFNNKYYLRTAFEYGVNYTHPELIVYARVA